jgi:hypothetical protein
VKNVPALGDTAINDLDLWIVDDPFNPKAGPDEDGFHYKSAGTSEPELVQMYRPIGKFNLIVVNASGVNTGYRLTFEWTTDALPTIFESLPPEFVSPVRPAFTPPTTAPAPAAPAAVDFGGPDATPVVQPSAPAPIDLGAGASSTPDSSFSTGFGDAPSLDKQLKAPPVVNFRPAAALKGPPPSAASLLLWLLALPLFVLALLAALLNRRRSAQLQI